MERDPPRQFYGPTRTTVSKLIAPYIDLYVKQHLTWEFSASNQQYLFHPTNDTSRCIVSGQWTTVVSTHSLTPAAEKPHSALLTRLLVGEECVQEVQPGQSGAAAQVCAPAIGASP